MFWTKPCLRIVIRQQTYLRRVKSCCQNAILDLCLCRTAGGRWFLVLVMQLRLIRSTSMIRFVRNRYWFHDFQACAAQQMIGGTCCSWCMVFSFQMKACTGYLRKRQWFHNVRARVKTGGVMLEPWGYSLIVWSGSLTSPSLRKFRKACWKESDQKLVDGLITKREDRNFGMDKPLPFLCRGRNYTRALHNSHEMMFTFACFPIRDMESMY